MDFSATASAFVAAILDRPEDDAPRLIFADWLDENGDPDRAEFIRLQIELFRMEADDPDRVPLRRRIGELQQPRHQYWLDELPRFPGVQWEVFERGFISVARFDTPDLFFEYAADAFAAAPVQEVRLHGFFWPQAHRLADVPEVSRVRVLDLGDGNRIGNSGIEVLAQSPHLAGLRALKLGRNSLGSTGVRAIAESPHLRGLEELKLERNDLFDDGLSFLARSPKMAALWKLDLARTRVGNGAMQALGQSPHLTGLRWLDLSGNLIGDEGIESLAGSEAVGQVRELFLYSNEITDRGVAAMAESPHFRRLERLHLRQNRIRDAGAMAIARSPYFDNVRELYLGENRISDEAADTLRARFGSRVNVF